MRINRTKFIAALTAVVALVLVGCGRTPAPGSPPTETAIPVRIGWMTSLAIQGQLVQALKHTDYLKQEGIVAEFLPYTFGPPQVEAALAGNLDVVNLGTVPMLTLLSKSDDWRIVSRNANVRFALVVPRGSSVTKLGDLKGRRIAVSIGSSAEEFILRQIQAGGFTSGDFTLVNIGPEEQGELARSSHEAAWGDIFALVSWDPTLSLLEDQGHARAVVDATDLTWTAMSKRFLDSQPKAAAGILRATLQAWAYYANNHDRMNEMYRKDAHLAIDNLILDKISNYDSNSLAKTAASVDISLNTESILRLSNSVSFLKQKERIDNLFSIDSWLQPQVLEQAQRAR